MRTHLACFPKILLLLMICAAALLSACPTEKPGERPGPPGAGVAAPRGSEEGSADNEPPATPGEVPAKGKQEQAPPPPPAAPAGPIEPLEPMALDAQEGLSQVVSRLQKAHYDPEGLGLTQLQFSLAFASKKTGITARGDGHWKVGGPPEVKIATAQKEGKEIPPPDNSKPEEVGKAIGWGDLEYKVLKLVEGISNGFLSRRLLEWRDQKGTVTRVVDRGAGGKKAGGGGQEKLQLSFKQEGVGDVLVTVGPHHVVERAAVHYKEGFTRAMTYSHQLEGGRNLVTRGLLTSEVDKGQKLHRNANRALEISEGTVFDITYGQVGRYMLPVKLVKSIPRMGEEMTLELQYSRAE